MRLIRLAPLAAIAVLAAACSGGGATPPPPTTAPAVSAEATAAPARIEVTLTDALKIEPASMTVPAGVPVTFIVTNMGKITHEFVLGDEAEQMEHEGEMASGGMDMGGDDAQSVSVDPGQTEELTVTFDKPGQTLAGCHVVGHYPAGMKASITIQ